MMSSTRPDDPRVTIVVTQRERFGFTERSLDTIYSETDIPFSLVYVDAGSPPSVQSLLEREARRRGFKLLRIDRYVPPNVARDLATAYVDSEVVVFVDNDLLVSHGWLQALIDCADETGAMAVGPVYLEGDLGEEIIHMAGGVVSIEERDGRRFFDDLHDHAHAEAAKTVADLERKPVDFVEFHCLLTRTQQLRDVGGLDRSLLSVHEHIDTCMTFQQAGGGIYLEPRSVVTYVPPPPLERGDLRVFLRRWSELWTHESLKHFAAKWGVEVSSGPATFSRGHRQIAFDPVMKRISRLLGKKIGPKVVVWLRRVEVVLNRLLIHRRPELNPESRGLVRVVDT